MGADCCRDSVWITVEKDCPELFSEDIITYQSCFDLVEYCCEIPLSEINNYSILDNGELYSGLLAGCNFDTIFSYSYFSIPNQGENGPYTLQSWTVGNTTYENLEFENITALIDLMNSFDPLGNWENNLQTFSIKGGFPETDYSSMIIRQNNTGAITTLELNMSLISKNTQLLLTNQTHNLVFTNLEDGCQDSFYVDIVCIPDTITNSVFIDGQIIICADSLGLMDSIVSVENTCEVESGENVNFIIDPITNCIIIEGITTGIDTACLEICTVGGFCQEIIVETTVVPLCDDLIAMDSIMIDANSCLEKVPICFDLLYEEIDSFSIRLNGIIYEDSIKQCTESSTNIELALYAGDYEMIVIDERTSCSDTVNLSINCIGDVIVIDTLFIGSIDTLCIDLDDFPGNPVSNSNDCPEESESVEFILDGFCVIYEGVASGESQACIVVCDDQDVCDTTFITVNVLSNEIMIPDASDDIDTTMENTSILVNVMTNDIMIGEMDTIYIEDNPENGTVIYNGDGTYIYHPNEGYCDNLDGDSFTYVLCNEFGCDTASVTIYTLCADLLFYTGISPNNDDVNDVFYVLGIGQYPDNDLCIFNRWGNQVFYTKNYQNDWRGTWNGKDLPDGTYFYVFNDGNGNTYSGYLQIHR